MRFFQQALLAAVALVPAIPAIAQDAPPERQRDWRADRGPRNGGAARQAPERVDVDRDVQRGGDWNRAPDQRRGDARQDERGPAAGRDGPRADSARDGPRPDAGRGDGRYGWQGRPAPAPQGADRRFDDRGGRGWTPQRADRRYADDGDWNRSWRNDRRYDWNGARAGNRGAYRLPRYYAPRGWGYGYQRFSVGVRLNSVLFGENYWIDDPYSYRLPPAYGPYRWVRYYDDALLVDVRYGRVVDVVYGIFW